MIGARRESVAIFDLDHTLVRRDSFAAFGRTLIFRAWWRLGLALAAGERRYLVNPTVRSRRKVLAVLREGVLRGEVEVVTWD